MAYIIGTMLEVIVAQIQCDWWCDHSPRNVLLIMVTETKIPESTKVQNHPTITFLNTCFEFKYCIQTIGDDVVIHYLFIHDHDTQHTKSRDTPHSVSQSVSPFTVSAGFRLRSRIYRTFNSRLLHYGEYILRWHVVTIFIYEYIRFRRSVVASSFRFIIVLCMNLK